MTTGTSDNSDFSLGERDRRILELNQRGLSGKQISIVLKSEGIILSKRSVLRHITELRQDPTNEVKVNHKYLVRTPKSEGRWYKIIAEVKKEIPEYTRRTGNRPSSRTMVYHLEDLGLIQPHEASKFTNATVLARLGWTDSNGELIYPKLDINCFSDDSRLTSGEFEDDFPELPIQPGEIPDPDQYIEDVIAYLKQAPENYQGVGEPGVDGKIGGRWYNQPNYVEVWEEKNDLMPDFENIFKDAGIKLRANKGYSSLVFLHQCTEELKQIMAMKRFKSENIYIKYFGDCDPSGRDIVNYIKKRLKQLGISGIHFDIVAVTHEQIRKYNLPLMSIEQSRDKKSPNPNSEEYRRLYGDEATHLNAFFTKKHYKDFKKIALHSVNQHWDKSIYDKMVEDYNVPADYSPALSDKTLRKVQNEMYRKITEAFKPGWDRDIGSQSQ